MPVFQRIGDITGGVFADIGLGLGPDGHIALSAADPILLYPGNLAGAADPPLHI